MPTFTAHQLPEFLTAFQTGGPLPVSGEEARHSLAIVMARQVRIQPTEGRGAPGRAYAVAREMLPQKVLVTPGTGASVLRSLSSLGRADAPPEQVKQHQNRDKISPLGLLAVVTSHQLLKPMLLTPGIACLTDSANGFRMMYDHAIPRQYTAPTKLRGKSRAEAGRCSGLRGARRWPRARFWLLTMT